MRPGGQREYDGLLLDLLVRAGVDAGCFGSPGDDLGAGVLVGDFPAEAVRDKRAAVLTDAYRAHPERFIRKPPHLPTGSWINPPDQPEEVTQ